MCIAYGAYIGTIYVNHIENNSVKIVFCNLLLKTRNTSDKQRELSSLSENNCKGLAIEGVVVHVYILYCVLQFVFSL